MGLAFGMTFRLPTVARLRDGLKGACLVAAPDGYAEGFALLVGLFNKVFL